jgi:hypothetical protein
MLADPRFDDLRPVSCAACGASVLVAKFSSEHTSVQWSLPAMGECLEFGAVVAAGGQTALTDGCGLLRSSIEAAVRSGRLPVASPLGPRLEPSLDPRLDPSLDPRDA